MNKEIFKILSNRELDVLACVANGHSYKRSALILKISDRTVNAHIRNICAKIGVGAKDQVIYFLDKNDPLDEIRKRFKNRETIANLEPTYEETKERDDTLEKILSALTSRLKELSENLEELSLSEDKKADFRIRLLSTIGSICKYKERLIEESVDCLKEALRLNAESKILSELEVLKLTFAVGEALVLLNGNDEAKKCLENALKIFSAKKDSASSRTTLRKTF